MNHLEQQKKDQKDQENLRVRYHIERVKSDRIRFKTALTEEWLEDYQFTLDSTQISEKLIEWHEKAKNDTQRSTLIDLIQATLRLKSFFNSRVALSKAAIVQILSLREENSKLSSKVISLQKTVDAQKKEIEYLSKE